MEKAHLAGESFRGIGRTFAVSEDAVERHLKAHLPVRLVKAAEKRKVAAETSRLEAEAAAQREENAEGSDLLDQLLELNKICRAVLADAYKAGERALALQAVARLERQFELRARLLGSIRDNQINIVNVQISPGEAERIARTFLQGPPPTFIEAALSETSAEPGS
jgi:hypothetical protein